MFQKREKKVSRDKLATYAAALGRGSLAYEALQEFDYQKAVGNKVEIIMGNNGFALRMGSERQSYGA